MNKSHLIIDIYLLLMYVHLIVCEFAGMYVESTNYTMIITKDTWSCHQNSPSNIMLLLVVSVLMVSHPVISIDKSEYKARKKRFFKFTFNFGFNFGFNLNFLNRGRTHMKPNIDKIYKTIMMIDVAECVQCDLNPIL